VQVPSPDPDAISAFTNRRLRNGETDRVFVDDVEMDCMTAAGEFLVATSCSATAKLHPGAPFWTHFCGGKVPFLDWPVDRLGVMQEAFGNRLLVAYVETPSLEVLAERFKADGRDSDGGRFRAGTAELERYWDGKFDGIFDLKVTSVKARHPSRSHFRESGVIHGLEIEWDVIGFKRIMAY
jgi:guanylate kinase